MNIVDLFDRGAAINRDGIYLIADETRIGYGEARARTLLLADALRRVGLGIGTRGAVLAPNDAGAWLATLALWRAGLAWVPLNPRNPVAENVALLHRFGVGILFYHPACADQARGIHDALGGRLRIVHLADADADFAVGLAGFLEGAEARPPAVTTRADDLAIVMPTGGTTGQPKGVMLSHRNLMAFAASFMVSTPYGDAAPVNLAAAPMTHTAGVLTLPAAARGGTVVMLARPEPDRLLQAIQTHRVTELFLPPTAIYRLIAHPGVHDVDWSSLRYFLYGAAPMAVDRLVTAMGIFGPVMTQFYGQSEAPIAIASLSPAEHAAALAAGDMARLRSCGRPTPFVKVGIFDADGQGLPAGTTGEICVAGDLVMQGYFEDPAQTRDAFFGPWLRTGDLGHLDADGYLTITDRRKDMIISGGFNVYPGEIEQVLMTVPEVADCAVIGIPDEDWGERVHAVVEPVPGATVDTARLAELCRARLGPVRTPKSWELVTVLPRSPAGKVLKRLLRDRPPGPTASGG